MPLMTAEQLRAHCLTRGLAWNDWDGRPAWWWTAEHRTLLELKMACALTP